MRVTLRWLFLMSIQKQVPLNSKGLFLARDVLIINEMTSLITFQVTVSNRRLLHPNLVSLNRLALMLLWLFNLDEI